MRVLVVQACACPLKADRGLFLNFGFTLASRICTRAGHVTTVGEVPRGEKMLSSGTDLESYITEYTLVHEDDRLRVGPTQRRISPRLL